MAKRAPGKPQPESCEAEIYRLGVLYCIDVPRPLSQSLGGGKYIAVAGSVNGVKMRGLLVPRGESCHRLFLDGKLRRAARAGQGDTVRLTLEPDPESREVPIPDEVLEAFEDEPGALDQFQRLTLAQRREMLLWVLKAKQAETRATRIARLVREMSTRLRAR
jgi:Bacteriocin-protection, YdeI or OmpD-Associated/Domain of unknown function (DUF1905)